ncbi:T9SS C-terminal target domain-containing protein [Aquimarina sp. BL5]|uniref:carbohydrate-binding protein n=1 Tax=Aquimarina sp. BL5 TaxID=1714860 RepID=UPI000E4E37BA|nr:carbohydrate-binding protein [Aquimarina sp. BL5]AXT53266.1 T9SS C-terminal target domain-containing protein [Aquimarina sp. BL5]RKN03207.1 carbohydrate-binding protein [Aquimarina sp. BL5]
MKLTKLNILIAFCIFGFVSNMLAQNRPFFNKNKDILIAQFDSKPDPDDIHAQAALGSMLAHSDLDGVNAFGVAGAYGRQGGQFIDSDQLFEMVFGTGNWTDADADRSGSIKRIANKVIPILNGGGKVWVQEAGQSNITRDWVIEVQKSVNNNVVKNNVIVVQHSEWNQNLADNTSNSPASNPVVLNFVRNNTTYFYIDDGNAPFGGFGDHGPWGTPEYRSRDQKWLNQALSSPNNKAKQLWTEAERVIAIRYPNGVPYDWSFMKNGGLDYSDCVENWWIFNIGNKADSVDKFWNRYVVNTTGSNPDPDQCVALEQNGVVAVEAEHFDSQSKTNDRKWYAQDGNTATPSPDPDPDHSSGASSGGYLEILPDTRVTHGDPLVNGVSFSNTPGQVAIINYKVKFTTPGKYFVWVRAHSTGSEDNGIHVGIDGNWPASGARMQWCAGKNQWTWESKQRTNANHCGEAEKIYINVPSAGVHTISFSMREDGFEIDKFVLSKSYTKPTGNGPDEVLVDCGDENKPPQVSITSPANGASFQIGQTIPLVANASDTDGTVSKVEFFINNNLTATEQAAPYDTSTTITNPGNYAITAKATDNNGAVTTSQSVNITIKDDSVPPTDAIDIPGSFEAENFEIKSGSVRIENTPGTTAGKNLGFIVNGDFVDYAVNVESSSEYTFDVYASSNGAGGKVDIVESGTVVGSIDIPVTGQWHSYKKYSTTVSLSSGEKVLRLSFNGGSGYLYNIDKVVATKIQSVEQTATLSPIHDAYLQGSTRYNVDMLRIEQNKRSGYLMFDLSSINGTITQADLKFTVYSDAGNGNVSVSKGNSNNWTETNLSNSNKPGKGVQLGSLNANFPVGSTKTIPLKTAQISGNKLSLIIDALSGNDFAFASKENGSVTQAQLVITYDTNRNASLDNVNDNITFYPNPVVDIINISGETAGKTIKMYNTIGVLVKEVVLQESQNTIDISDLSSGIYIVNILEAGKTNNILSAKKVLKR